MNFCIRTLARKKVLRYQQRSYLDLFAHGLGDGHYSFACKDGIRTVLASSLSSLSHASVQRSLLTWRLRQALMNKAQLALKTNIYPRSCNRDDIRNAWKKLYGMNRPLYWQRVWHNFHTKNILCKSLQPPFGHLVRAVTLAFSWSHLTIGLLAIAIGCMNGRVTEAQPFIGNASAYSSSHLSHAYFPALVISVVDFLATALRAVYLSALFTPSVLLSPFANLFGSHFRKAWLHLVCHTLELAGAAFIKWGQWASTRPDLFPKDLCVELSKLQMKAPAHKYSYTAQTVEKAFGCKLQDIFEEFDEEPIASGSIAQVHRATLRIGHRNRKSKPMLVAVKVRHPGVGEVIRRDFIIINWIARLCKFVPGLQWLRLDESVQQFSVFMQTQVDLAREAAHLCRFLYNFRQWKDVSFPQPLYPLVHPAVLVETYEKGESVSRFVELSERSRINSALAHIGTHTLLKMLLVDNFIHADMHPGNILVRVERKRSRPGRRFFPSRPHVVILDVGMTAELSGADRANLLDFFKAVAERDGRRVAEFALKFSSEQSCPNPKAFIEEVESSFKLWSSEAGDDMHPGECLQDLLEQARRHRVNIDGEVCTVMVTTMVLEGWQRKLDPDYNLMNTLQSILFKVDMVQSLSYTIHGIMAP